MSDIKISVIIPVYNAEKYIRECLDSILKQSLRDIEVICVDDGSTDSSLGILNEYKNIDSRIIIIHQENLHAGIARNKGMKEATGEYIHFLDADDWLVDSDVYSKWYSIAKNNGADVCTCERYIYDNETNTYIQRGSNFVKFGNYITMVSLEPKPQLLICGQLVPWNKLYRRQFLKENGIFFDDLICSNDRYFYFQVIFKVKKMIAIKDWWINHRINTNTALTGELRLKNYDCHFKSFANIWNLVENYRDEIKDLILYVEMYDFLTVYQRSKCTQYEETIRKQLYDFFTKWDISAAVNRLNKDHINSYLEIIKNSANDPIANSISTIYEKKLAIERKNSNEAKTKFKDVLQKLKSSQVSETSLRNSTSFRLGRIITWLPRKIHGGFVYYRQHGIVYTLKRFL